jgi:DNA polymerase-1
VCFDKARAVFRHERYAEYKANRSATPDEFRQQLPLIREVLSVLRVPVLEAEGYEADDLLATLARKAVEEGDEVVVVTGDRDALQLIRPGVSVMMTRRGISDIARFDEAAVVEKYGVTPAQWTDFAALKGETSDNLPGVPGVGDKTASQLVSTYGNVEGVIEHASELRPRIRDALIECADQVRLNKELGRLLDDLEVDVQPDDLRLEPWDDEEVRKLFTSLEFPTLYARMKELALTATAPVGMLEDVTWCDLSDVPEGELAVAWDAATGWMAVSAGDSRACVLPFDAAPARLGEAFADASRPKVAHDAKVLVRMVLEAGGTFEGLDFDTQLAAFLLEPGAAGGYPLQDTVRRYLGVAISEEPEAKPKKAKQGTLDLDPPSPEHVARSAVAVRALRPQLEQFLHNRGLWDVFASLELPLVGVLAKMERAGIMVDLPYLEELDTDLGHKLARLEGRIHELAGEPFNVNSTPQLQRILFEKLDLPKTKKIKTGWSTDQAELAKLVDEHPIVEALVEYREVVKLKTGFTDALIPLVDPKSGRIHTTYSQVSASTGRLASTAPNMQNIPIRAEMGRQIRRAFIAPSGFVLLSADYSQIELRVLAHLTRDAGLLDAFASRHDFHAAIAAKTYGIPVEEVSPTMRSYAKQFSYGIVYGMSAYGVSQRLGIDMDSAREFVDAYYAQFPNVKAFLDAQVAKAAQDGFTTTIFGRRRYLPELQSPNPRIRSMGERMALNAPIQGSAADIMKKAMLDVDAALRGSPEVATMLLTVHDELVFEVPEEGQDAARELVCSAMESAADLVCGLEVDVHFGPNWAAAHA